MNKNGISYTQVRNTTIVDIEMTKIEEIEIRRLWEIYKRQYRKELKLFLDAFIAKHNIFSDDATNGEEGGKLTQEEINKIIDMMRSMDEVPIYKALG